MTTADREVRIDLRPDPTAFMVLLALAAVAWIIWYSVFEPTMAPVLVSLGALLGLRLIQRPLTLRRAVLVTSDKLIVASRRLLRRQKQLELRDVKALREQQVGSKENTVYELELVLESGRVRKLGKLGPGFRPKLRSAQSMLRRSKG